MHARVCALLNLLAKLNVVVLIVVVVAVVVVAVVVASVVCCLCCQCRCCSCCCLTCFVGATTCYFVRVDVHLIVCILACLFDY